MLCNYIGSRVLIIFLIEMMDLPLKLLAVKTCTSIRENFYQERDLWSKNQEIEVKYAVEVKIVRH